MAATKLYASCRLDDLVIGIDVDRVREVTAGSRLTPVPLAPPLVSGLLNLRGEIVTAIDLRRCLQLPERPADQRPVHVIVATTDGWVSLLVDEVGDVVTLDPKDLEPAPAAVSGPIGELFAGAYRLGDGLLLAVDIDGVLAVAARDSTMNVNGG